MVHPLILASSSPRRVQLLRAAGFAFEAIASPVEELHDAGMDFRKLCETNAERKARDVASRHPCHWIIGADTLVSLDGIPLGKPRDQDDARAMLRALSGRINHVCTGVCVIDPTGKADVFHELTEVEFRPLTEEMIIAYMAKVNTLDKAGAYAAQEHGDDIICAIRGDFTNVVGLPMNRLREFL
jgi:septum formation protein